MKERKVVNFGSEHLPYQCPETNQFLTFQIVKLLIFHMIFTEFSNSQYLLRPKVSDLSTFEWGILSLSFSVIVEIKSLHTCSVN